MEIAVGVVFMAAGFGLPVYGGEHSLFYIYTALSKPLNLSGVYDFTAMGMLDDRELDYYNSEDQVKVPKQTWMKEKMQKDYWDKGTQSRKSKEQWFRVNVEILMERMRHNKTDLHVLQWRHGCRIDEGPDGSVTFKKGIDEYSYDGSEFLSFDDENSRWIAPVQAAEPTKKKWDDVDILNQYTKSYLEKECVKWLTEFMGYGKETLRKHLPPEVHIFQKKSLKDAGKLTLTCMATGFYPPDVVVKVRKCKTSLPDHLITSSENRPNNDGTYQRRVSVEVEEREIELYNCYVSHSTLEKPIIKAFGSSDRVCDDSESPNIAIIAAVISVLVLVIGGISGGILIAKKWRKHFFFKEGNGDGDTESKKDSGNGSEISQECTALIYKPETSEGKGDGDLESKKDSGNGSESSQESIAINDKLKTSESPYINGHSGTNQNVHANGYTPTPTENTNGMV